MDASQSLKGFGVDQTPFLAIEKDKIVDWVAKFMHPLDSGRHYSPILSNG